MKKEYMALLVGGIALAVGLTLMLTLSLSPTTEATNTPGTTITDHALFDSSGGAEFAVGCKSNKSFDVHISVQDVNADGATFKVLFINDTGAQAVASELTYTVPNGQSVNISQAAGSTPDADTHLVVSVQAAGTAVGWMSLSTQNSAVGFGGLDVDYCKTYATQAAAIADE